MKYIAKFGLFTVLLLIQACSEEPKTSVAEPRRPVKVMEVGINNQQQSRSFPCLAQAKQTIQSSFRIGGTIRNIFLKLGEHAPKGTVIAELEQSDYLSRLSQTEAGVDVAKARADNAGAQYQRIKNLYETESVSKNDLDALYTGYQVAEAGLKQASEEKQLAKKQLSYTQLLMPEDHCWVAKLVGNPNENISPGQPVVILECGSELNVQMALPETMIGIISKGRTLPVLFSSQPEKSYTGVITEVGVSSGVGGTFPIKLSLLEQSDKLRPGMTCEASVSIPNLYNGGIMMVPLVAVASDQNGPFVYVFKAVSEGARDGIALRRSVEIGQTSTEGIEIKKGLNVGERIITAGIKHLQDGLKIKIAE